MNLSSLFQFTKQPDLVLMMELLVVEAADMSVQQSSRPYLSWELANY